MIYLWNIVYDKMSEVGDGNVVIFYSRRRWARAWFHFLSNIIRFCLGFKNIVVIVCHSQLNLLTRLNAEWILTIDNAFKLDCQQKFVFSKLFLCSSLTQVWRKKKNINSFQFFFWGWDFFGTEIDTLLKSLPIQSPCRKSFQNILQVSVLRNSQVAN